MDIETLLPGMWTNTDHWWEVESNLFLLSLCFCMAFSCFSPLFLFHLIKLSLSQPMKVCGGVQQFSKVKTPPQQNLEKICGGGEGGIKQNKTKKWFMM